MLIKIQRIEPNNVCEEFVNTSEILSCRKEKVVDIEAKPICKTCWIDVDQQLRLQIIQDSVTYKVYKDRYTGDIFAFRDYDVNHDNLHTEYNDTEVKPGWNKVEIANEVFHYEYWIELPSTSSTTRFDKTYWDPGYNVKTSSNARKIQITEETYNKITQALVDDSK